MFSCFLLTQSNVLVLSWRGAISYRSQSLICRANQWTGFYMITASVMKELMLRTIASLRISLKLLWLTVYSMSMMNAEKLLKCTVICLFCQTAKQPLSNLGSEPNPGHHLFVNLCVKSWSILGEMFYEKNRSTRHISPKRFFRDVSWLSKLILYFTIVIKNYIPMTVSRRFLWKD